MTGVTGTLLAAALVVGERLCRDRSTAGLTVGCLVGAVAAPPGSRSWHEHPQVGRHCSRVCSVCGRDPAARGPASHAGSSASGSSRLPASGQSPARRFSLSPTCRCSWCRLSAGHGSVSRSTDDPFRRSRRAVSRTGRHGPDATPGAGRRQPAHRCRHGARPARRVCAARRPLRPSTAG